MILNKHPEVYWCKEETADIILAKYNELYCSTNNINYSNENKEHILKCLNFRNKKYWYATQVIEMLNQMHFDYDPNNETNITDWLSDYEEKQVIRRLINIINQISTLLKDGKTLEDIRQWSYEERNAGKDMIYFRFYYDQDTEERIDTCIYPAPLYEQANYHHFFQDCLLVERISKNHLEIYKDGRIEFYSLKNSDGKLTKRNYL